MALSPKQFLQQELALEGLTLSKLNSRKNITKKNELLYRMIQEQVIREATMKEALQYVRESGLKFQDKTARNFYREFKKYEPNATYGARISRKDLPDKNKIPLIQNPQVKGIYYYLMEVFLGCKSKEVKERREKSRYKKVRNKPVKDKKLPKNALVANSQYYNDTSFVMVMSEDIITGSEAENYFMLKALGADLNKIENALVIESSDSREVFKRDCYISGFRLSKVMRS